MKTLIWETHDEHAYRTTPAELLADNHGDEAVADAVAYLKGEAKKRGFHWSGVCFGGGASGLTFITVRHAGVVLPHEDEMADCCLYESDVPRASIAPRMRRRSNPLQPVDSVLYGQEQSMAEYAAQQQQQQQQQQRQMQPMDTTAQEQEMAAYAQRQAAAEQSRRAAEAARQEAVRQEAARQAEARRRELAQQQAIAAAYRRAEGNVQAQQQGQMLRQSVAASAQQRSASMPSYSSGKVGGAPSMTPSAAPMNLPKVGMKGRRSNPAASRFVLLDAGPSAGHHGADDRYTLICTAPQGSGSRSYYNYLGFGTGVSAHGEFSASDFRAFKAEGYRSLGKRIKIESLPASFHRLAERFMSECG